MRLGDLLDLEMLRRLARANYQASGMPIGIVDAEDGSILVGFGWQDICTLYHRVNPASLERCRESDEHIKLHLSEAAPVAYTCKNGLRDIGVPIRVEGHHVATMFLGQFFYEDESPDRAFFVEQARQFGFDPAGYLAALERVPVFSRAAVDNILTYNTALASFIGDLAEGAVRRRRAEADAESLARFPQESPDPVLRVASDLTVAYANAAALSTFGVAPGVRAAGFVADLARSALAARGRVQNEVATAAQHFSVTAVAFGDDVNLYAHDITTRMRAEEALRERDERLREAMQRLESLLENSPLAVVEWSTGDFRIVRWSGEATRIFGWTADEAVGRGIDHLGLVHPDDRAEVVPLIKDMLSGARPRNVSRHRNVRKDGGVIHCEWYNSTVSTASGQVASVLSLVLDVTEQKRVEQELRDASRAKDDFLGMLSHELRNPLAPIRNALYILDHAEPNGQQARKAKEVASRQVIHLARLVDDLLDVTRIVRGKVELRRTRIDVGDLARRTGEDHRALMHERGLAFEVQAPREAVWVHGDETRLAQVMGNLLQNAAKFTPDGGSVTLSVEQAGDAAEIRVRDTGSGIASDLLGHIFDPFVQAKQSLARTEGGLGLGLALVRGLVELHGGAVSAESAGIGRGAAFTVRLPLLARADTPRAGRSPDGAHEPARLRVLVVDDSRDAAESLADVVRMLGHEADVVFDGRAALASVASRLPDVVLCDIGLPGFSGYDVAQALRGDPRFAGVRLVAVSGYAQQEDRKRALAAGFLDHIAKPPDLGRLARLLAGTAALARA